MSVAWKAFELRVAKLFGGRRRGPDTRGARGGKNDIICEVWSPECALLQTASYSHILGKAKQSERNCVENHVPIAIVKKKYTEDADSLVVMRLATFAEWFLNPGSSYSRLPARENEKRPDRRIGSSPARPRKLVSVDREGDAQQVDNPSD